jgi:uncharacterized membrane-anchored protein
MISILWFLVVAFGISVSIAWILDNNGFVMIEWMSYQVKTDVLTAIILTISFTFFIFALSHILARILALKFPNFFKVIFKKTYLAKLEDLAKRNLESFDLIAQTLISLECSDIKSAKNFQKKLSIKNQKLNSFLLGKIAYQEGNFEESEKYFMKLGEGKYAQILLLKSKFKLSLEGNDNISAIAYGKQILSINKDNLKVAKTLFLLHKKTGSWQEAKCLIAEYGSENFSDDLKKRDATIVNTALASDFYRKKDFASAIKYAKIALKSEENFLPAIEIIMKSLIKRGLSFKVSWMIKKLWQDNPHLILAEIFDLAHHKFSKKNRIKLIKKLVSLNNKTYLSEMAVGLVAFRVSDYETAKEFLKLSLEKEKTYRAYKILGFAEKFLGNENSANECFRNADLTNKNDHYFCSNCGYSSIKWAAVCNSCQSPESLEW